MQIYDKTFKNTELKWKCKLTRKNTYLQKKHLFKLCTIRELFLKKLDNFTLNDTLQYICTLSTNVFIDSYLNNFLRF